MRKTYKIKELDCANCAAKMEDAVKKIEGVSFAGVNFLTQKLTVEADDADFDEIMKKAVRVCRRIEPCCKIIL